MIHLCETVKGRFPYPPKFASIHRVFIDFKNHANNTMWTPLCWQFCDEKKQHCNKLLCLFQLKTERFCRGLPRTTCPFCLTSLPRTQTTRKTCHDWLYSTQSNATCRLLIQRYAHFIASFLLVEYLFSRAHVQIIFLVVLPFAKFLNRKVTYFTGIQTCSFLHFVHAFIETNLCCSHFSWLVPSLTNALRS